MRTAVLFTATVLAPLCAYVLGSGPTAEAPPAVADAPDEGALRAPLDRLPRLPATPPLKVRPGTRLAPKPLPKTAPQRANRSAAAHPRHSKPSRAKHRHPASAARKAGRKAGRTLATTGGADISWPQCPHTVGIPDLTGLDQPMPDRNVRFVVVGLTNGRSFTRNPCLDTHLRWVRRHHVWASAYAFTTYPTKSQLRVFRASGPFDRHGFIGKLKNAAYATAHYNVRTLQRSGFRTPHVWVDIEPSSSRPWSGRVDWNRAVVQGWVRAYRDAGYTVGFYSTSHLWTRILGELRLGAPEWRTAGPDTARAALGKCRARSFQGGRGVIAQWWDRHHDHDRMCRPFASGKQMQRFFHRY